MEKIFTSLRRPAQKWVIDRFEESWAVLENSDSHEVISLPATNLPNGVEAGSTLIKHGSKWYVDEADTAARAARISERFARIKEKNK
jgi:hypothetical protein